MPSKMPRIDTLRRYYPDCKLSDDELLKTAEWVKNYLRLNHIHPDNKILKAILAYSKIPYEKRS